MDVTLTHRLRGNLTIPEETRLYGQIWSSEPPLRTTYGGFLGKVPSPRDGKNPKFV